MSWRYPLSSPDTIDATAIDAAIISLRSGRLTMGRHVEAFEETFARHVGARYAVMVNSGSSANLLAVEALLRPTSGERMWQAGDEVLVPALSWSTTVWPLVQLGLVPVFVDVDPETLAIDLNHAAYMTSSRTKGMMLIHVLGLRADVEAATAFCEVRGITLIEDCCEAFGADVGRHGRIATWSHYFSHQLSTIEGGTITTDDPDIYRTLRSARAHGWSRDRPDVPIPPGIDPRFCFIGTGYNVRPLELQGAIGVAQLEEAADRTAARRLTGRILGDMVDRVPGLSVPGKARVLGDRHVPWMNLPILVDHPPLTRGAVMQALEAGGVETRPILAGNLLRHPVMQPKRFGYLADREYPVADRIMRDGLMIGCHGSYRDAAAAVEPAFNALVEIAA